MPYDLQYYAQVPRRAPSRPTSPPSPAECHRDRRARPTRAARRRVGAARAATRALRSCCSTTCSRPSTKSAPTASRAASTGRASAPCRLHHLPHALAARGDHVIQLDPNGSISAQGAPSTLSDCYRAQRLRERLEHQPERPRRHQGRGSAAPAAAAPARAPAAPAKKESASDEARKKRASRQRTRTASGTAPRWCMRYAKALGWCNVWLGLLAPQSSASAQLWLSYLPGIWSTTRRQDAAGRRAMPGLVFPRDLWRKAVVLPDRVLRDGPRRDEHHPRALGRHRVCLRRCGRRIHDVALKACSPSPAAFFDVTPVGRILNRFSTQKVDVQLASALSQFISYVVSLRCTPRSSSSTRRTPSPPSRLPLPHLLVLLPQLGARSAAPRPISKSPIYAAFGEALNGATTIQAYAANARFEEANRRRSTTTCAPTTSRSRRIGAHGAPRVLL